jgi:hypothetical protein
MAGHELLRARRRGCGFTETSGRNSGTAKTKKDNERKLIYEKSK